MANTRLELERIKKENKVLQDFLAGNKTDTTEQDVKASKVQSIKVSDPFVTTGNTGIDIVLDADVRGKRGVSDAKRLKAKEASLPEDVRIKRQFEQIYRKQVAETRKTRLANMAKNFINATPEGGVSPYDTMDAELSSIMRSRLNLPEEEQETPSFMDSLKNRLSSFFADKKGASTGETLVDTISGERVKPLSEMTDEELEAIQ